MALSIREQLDILSGIVTPTDSNYSLAELVTQVSVNEAQVFIQNMKNIDPATDLPAYSYLMKYLSICTKLLNNAQQTETTSKLLIAIYADTGNYATVLTATTDDWSNFLAANITEAFKILAETTPSEIAAYEAI